MKTNQLKMNAKERERRTIISVEGRIQGFLQSKINLANLIEFNKTLELLSIRNIYFNETAQCYLPHGICIGWSVQKMRCRIDKPVYQAFFAKVNTLNEEAEKVYLAWALKQKI